MRELKNIDLINYCMIQVKRMKELFIKRKTLSTALGAVTYHYQAAAPGQTTVLFISGFGWNSTYYNFKHLMDQLPVGVGQLAVDTIGTGESVRTNMVRSVNNILQNLHAVLHHEQVTNVLILGHSLGGVYARLYQLRHPSEVTGLLLLEPPYSAMAPMLQTQVLGLIANYKQIAIQKRSGQLTAVKFINDVCPLNTPAEQLHNANIYFNAYGSRSVLSEAQLTSSLVAQM